MEELLSGSNFKRDEHNRPKMDEVTLAKQRAAVTLLATFCKDTKCDFSQYVPQLMRSLIMLFTSQDEVVLTQSWNALSYVTKGLDATGKFFSEFKVSLASLNFPPKMKNFQGQILT